MYKKLIMSCMAVAAFAAFVLPAVASASNKPTMTDSGGIVKVGAKVWGINVGNTILWNTEKTETAQVTCTTATMTGEVTANANDTVEGKITSAIFSGTGAVHADTNQKECTTNFGTGAAITGLRLPWTIRSTAAMATDEFQVSGNGGNIRFLIKDTLAGDCEYEETGVVKGDVTTSDTEAKLTTRDNSAGSGAKLISGGFFCPSSGSLGMTFIMETEAGGKIGIMPTA